MDLRNVDEDWLIKELRKKLPSFDYPPEHRKLVGYANSLTSPESQGEMINAMFGVTAPVGDLTKLAIGHANLKSASIKALEDALNSRRAINVDKKLPFDTSTGSVRDEIARRNAVDMLGLPETNTAMDRANAMGYTQNAFHGTPYGGKIQKFGSEHRGRTTSAESAKLADWATDNPIVASDYANQPIVNDEGYINSWFQFQENYSSPKIDKLRAKIQEYNNKITQLHDLPQSPEKSTKLYNLLDEKNQIWQETQRELSEAWKELNPARESVYPLRVKDATTFNPKQQSALDQLNALVNGPPNASDEFLNSPEYIKFKNNISESWGLSSTIDDRAAIKALHEILPSYETIFDPRTIFYPDFLLDRYKELGFDDLYKKFGPQGFPKSTLPEEKKLVRKIPTVYDAKGKGYGSVPKGLSGQLNKAPEGTEVFRFNNLVDPEPASTHYAIMKPNAVRSRFAAFDPARRSSSDLLAGVAAGSLSLQALLDLLNEDQYR